VLEGDGKVGFHAAYKGESDYTVSASGNAVAGAYMARLGLNDFVITYATEAAPREMRWLTPGDAKFIGLDVSWHSPSAVISSPYVMTRAEIEEDLINTPEFPALKKRFPKYYGKLVDIVYEAQAAGDNWEKVALEAIGKMPNIDADIFSTSPDALLVESFQINFSYLKYLEKHDPTLCASYGLPEDFPLNRAKYLANRPDNIRTAYHKNSYKMIAGPVLSRRPLTKSDRQYIKRKLLAITLKITPKFTKREIVRIRSPKRNQDAKLACKFTIAMVQAMLVDTRLISLLIRYPNSH
jgi:hypothetical protein